MVQLTKDEILNITRRLQNVRQGLIQKAPFYAILLFGLRFSLDDMVERVYTDGERIAFNPDFLNQITDKELEFIMLHEVSHVALGHPFRRVTDYDIEIYDEACDIVVNSNIYKYMGEDESFISIKGLGVMPHKASKDEEGYLFTVEQVYEKLFKKKGKIKRDEFGTTPDFTNISDEQDEDNSDGSNDNADNQNQQPLDNGQNDNAQSSGQDNGTDKATQSDGGNSSTQTSSKGNGKIKGKGFSEALKLLPQSQIKKSTPTPITRFDDHSFWKGEDNQDLSKVIWESRVLQTCEAVKNVKRIYIKNKGKGYGDFPLFAERMIEEISERKLDWKTLLNDFIQEEICDYSFSPPDRRFSDSDFFLPDFNEKEEAVENLLFMIDTSGSMSDGAIAEVYSEIKGAIEQFNGKIKGWLGFFDAQVTEPKPFEDEDEFKAIRIKGGGGTSFLPIFRYVRDNMKDANISSIIILTDGDAPYPKEEERMNIPVLWIINNEYKTPPWGMIARIPQKPIKTN